MDIEKLSKSQIILLTLLVSFVTSIATGIVTVSLMDQAPPAIAQTVNRVIERTIEKVVSTGQTASTVVTTEKTVVVKEADMIALAVKKVSPSVVRLYSGEKDDPAFLGLAVVLDSAGVLVSDGAALGDIGNATVMLSDGTRVRVFVQSRDTENGIVLLQAATSTATGTTPWIPVTLSASFPTLGESVVVLAGKTTARIADGIITALVPRPGAAGDIIETSVSSSASVMGSPLVDTNGSVIGISTEVSRATSAAGFVSVSVLLRAKDAVSSKNQ